MASGSGGIDLLSLYNDEEDEDEMDEAQVPPVVEKQLSASAEVAQPEAVTRTMEIDVASIVEASSTEREMNHQLSSFTSPPPAECLKDTQVFSYLKLSLQFFVSFNLSNFFLLMSSLFILFSLYLATMLYNLARS